MELLKKILGTMLDLVKQGFDLLRGKGLGELLKKLGAALGALLLVIGAGTCLRGLHKVGRKAGKLKKQVRRLEKKRARSKERKKKSLAKKLARKARQS